jgi:hypothetical protein
MTPQRFLEALDHVHWTQKQVAQLLECELSLIEAWAAGKEHIPPEIGMWLEALAETHEAVGLPRSCRGGKPQNAEKN